MNQILCAILYLTIVSVSHGQDRGIDAREDQFKYQATVYFIGDPGFVICGGAIINEWYVLTSADCMKYYAGKLRNFVLYFGTTNIHEPQQIRTIAELIFPKNYKMFERHHDIALIRTNRKIQFSDNVQPVNLPSSSDAFNEILVSSGFGIRFVS